MKKKYGVIWANIAEADLSEIVKYIYNDKPYSALQILRKIKEKTENLYHSPKRGRIVPELKEQGISQYRELIVPPWRIIYRISEKDIYVLAVIDSRQNVEDILLKRFIEGTEKSR